MKKSKIGLVLLISIFFCTLKVVGQKSVIELEYGEYYTPKAYQNRTVFVWNTKTGKSARYYYDNKIWNKSTVALPINPVH